MYRSNPACRFSSALLLACSLISIQGAAYGIKPLTAEQATLYGATVEDVLSQIEEDEGINRRGLVLKLLTGLKQICNHPSQLSGDGDYRPTDSGKFIDAAHHSRPGAEMLRNMRSK